MAGRGSLTKRVLISSLQCKRLISGMGIGGCEIVCRNPLQEQSRKGNRILYMKVAAFLSNYSLLAQDPA